ncbi:MAG: hypothetical protein J1E60_06580 [Christensenellaceae bacterium]|nr:hypothetical protein [Christensenellaceae bacterium]
MKCKKCGHNNPDMLDVCEKCSAPLNKDAAMRNEPDWGFTDTPESAIAFDDMDLDALEKQFLAGVDDWSGVASVATPKNNQQSGAARNSDVNRNRGNQKRQTTENAASQHRPVRGEVRMEDAQVRRSEASRARVNDEQARRSEAPRVRVNDEQVRRSEALRVEDEQTRRIDIPRVQADDEKNRRREAPYIRVDDDQPKSVNTVGEGMPFDADDYSEVKRKRSGRTPGAKNKHSYGTDSRTRIVVIVALIAIVLLGAIIAIIVREKAPANTGSNTQGTHVNQNAEITQNPDDPNCYYVKVFAKPGDTLVFENSGGEQKSIQVSDRGFVIFNVPYAAMLPNEPIESATFDAYPIVYKQELDGSLTKLEMPYVTLNVPQLNVQISTPETIECDNGTAYIEGSIDHIDSVVTINGEQVMVNSDGSFKYELKYDQAGTYGAVFEAKLAGYGIVSKKFTVNVTKALEPWEIVVISDDFQTRVVNVETSIEVYGTVPVGTTLTVRSSDEEFSLATEPTVDASGRFNFKVNLPTPAKNYEMTIVAALPNGSTIERPFAVQRPPVYNEFVPTVWAGNYSEIIKPAHFNTQGFKLQGTISEIIEDADYLKAKLVLTTGETVIIVYYDHYSAASNLEVGGSYIMYGIPTGLNSEAIPELFIWFVQD